MPPNSCALSNLPDDAGGSERLWTRNQFVPTGGFDSDFRRLNKMRGWPICSRPGSVNLERSQTTRVLRDRERTNLAPFGPTSTVFIADAPVPSILLPVPPGDQSRQHVVEIVGTGHVDHRIRAIRIWRYLKIERIQSIAKVIGPVRPIRPAHPRRIQTDRLHRLPDAS